MKNGRRARIARVAGTVLFLAAAAVPASAGSRQAGNPASGIVRQENRAGGETGFRVPVQAQQGPQAGQRSVSVDPGSTAPAGPGATFGRAYCEPRNVQRVVQNRQRIRTEDTGAGPGRGFVDEDGDGTNDLARDSDSDGIPNGQDSDWVKNKKDGTGQQQGAGSARGGKRGGQRGAGSSGCPNAR